MATETTITETLYKGYAISSHPEKKGTANKGWFAFPPDYDADSDNGARIITGDTLAEVKSQIDEKIA